MQYGGVIKIETQGSSQGSIIGDVVMILSIFLSIPDTMLPTVRTVVKLNVIKHVIQLYHSHRRRCFILMHSCS